MKNLFSGNGSYRLLSKSLDFHSQLSGRDELLNRMNYMNWIYDYCEYEQVMIGKLPTPFRNLVDKKRHFEDNED